MAPSEAELLVIKNPTAIIEKPAVAQQKTGKGDKERWYTPAPVSKADIMRVTGIDEQKWRSIKGSIRTLFTAHDLYLKVKGNRLPWAKKNGKNKTNAFKELESQFPILRRCEAHWAADAMFETHWDYYRQQVRLPW